MSIRSHEGPIEVTEEDIERSVAGGFYDGDNPRQRTIDLLSGTSRSMTTGEDGQMRTVIENVSEVEVLPSEEAPQQA